MASHVSCGEVLGCGRSQQASEAISAAGVRQRYPTADEAEVRQRVIALRLGRELSIAVYGWDSEVHGW